MSKVAAIVKLWLAFRPIKRIKERRARKRGETVSQPSEVFDMLPQGYQTLSGVAILLLTPWAAKFGLTDEDVKGWVMALGTVLGGVWAVTGYLRRKKLPVE